VGGSAAPQAIPGRRVDWCNGRRIPIAPGDRDPPIDWPLEHAVLDCVLILFAETPSPKAKVNRLDQKCADL